MKIASIDIGKKNLAILIEEFDEMKLKTLTPPPVSQRRNRNGTLPNEMKTVINEVYKNGKILFFNNEDLTTDTSSNIMSIQLFYNFNKYLMKLKPWFDKCDVILIEKQLMVNPMAIKLAQHVFSFFTFLYPDREKELIEYNASNKTQVLGCEMNLTKTKKGLERYKPIDKPKRKKWSVLNAIEILKLRTDTKNLNELNLNKKNG